MDEEIETIDLVQDAGGGLHILLWPGATGYTNVQYHMRPDLYTSFAYMLRDVRGPGLLDGALEPEDLSDLADQVGSVEPDSPVEVATYDVGTGRLRIHHAVVEMSDSAREFLAADLAAERRDRDRAIRDRARSRKDLRDRLERRKSYPTAWDHLLESNQI